jgi:hypothetical protein
LRPPCQVRLDAPANGNDYRGVGKTGREVAGLLPTSGVLLVDETVAERSRVTGVDRDTIGEKARPFLEVGTFGLVDRRTTAEKGRRHHHDVVSGPCITGNDR